MAKLNETNKYGVGIRGVGYYVPDKVITNFDLMKEIDTSDEWIKTRLGISERRRASEEQTLAELATKAGRKAIENAKLEPKDIDLVILARIVPDHIDPATSCKVQHEIGAINAGAFDVVVGGCPGSVYALTIGANFVASGAYKNVLVICGDILSKTMLDFKHRDTCCFFGDGAGAVVLSRVALGKGIQNFLLKSDGSQYDAACVKGGGVDLPLTKENIEDRNIKYLRMDNKAIWNFATKVFPESIQEVVKEGEITIQDLDLIIAHQANINIIKASLEKLNLSMEKTHTTIEKYGNTLGASVLITLCDALEKGRIKQGDNIAMVSYGAGLAWGALYMKWCSEEDFISDNK